VNRPLGVTLFAILLAGWSVLALARALTAPGARLGQKALLFVIVVSVLGLFAAEALWRLRSYAFVAFTLWGFCAMAGFVMSRLPLSASGHGIRLMGPIASAGLAYGVAALYLRRAL
jgi:hypothetical protein